jgi:hypothetical protein
MRPGAAPLDLRDKGHAAVFRVVRSGLVRGALALASILLVPAVPLADEGGVSFWLPGLFGNLGDRY